MEKYSKENKEIYFQKQKTMSNLCGVHTINNLLGDQICSEKQLDQICSSLSKDFINPHKHVFGGDYDVNILTIALQRLGCQCKWLDGRHLEDLLIEQSIQNKNRIGYIVNQKQEGNKFKQLFGLSQRHWVAVKRQKEQYYLLDSLSKKDRPVLIKDMTLFIQGQVLKESHLFEVLIKIGQK